MSGPVGELERRLALPGIQIIRVRGPPASGKSWLIKTVKDRGANELILHALNQSHRIVIHLTFSCYSGRRTIQIQNHFITRMWCGPPDPARPTMITCECNSECEPEVYPFRHVERLELLGRRGDCEFLDDATIVIHGADLEPKPRDIALPSPGKWSRSNHRVLPMYCRRWFCDVFMILWLYSVRTQRVPSEMIEAILSELRASAF